MDQAHIHSELVLNWHNERVGLDLEFGDGRLRIGRAVYCELRVERRFTSREHVILQRKDRFIVLTDCSTNGTYVQTEDEQVCYLHRSSLRLWGEGWFSLGEPLSEAGAVRFSHHQLSRQLHAVGQ